MKKRGMGASLIHHNVGLTGGGDPSEAVVRVKTDGSIDLLVGTSELGQGSRTVFAQIAADELGVPYEQVTVINADTDVTPFCTGSFASRATYVTGNAIRQAAGRVKETLLDVACQELEIAREDLSFEDGKIVARGYADKSMTIANAAASGTLKMGKPIIAAGSYEKPRVQIDPDTGACEPYDAYAYATCIAEVEVDTNTGQVEVLKLIMAYDVGKAINPLLVESQVRGGTAIGLGFTLMENLLPFYPTTNQQPSSFKDYTVPMASDMPEMKVIIVEEPSPRGPYGAKGIGEFTSNSQSAAIVNAIYNAAGVRICDLPVTPEKILSALEQKANK